MILHDQCVLFIRENESYVSPKLEGKNGLKCCIWSQKEYMHKVTCHQNKSHAPCLGAHKEKLDLQAWF